MKVKRFHECPDCHRIAPYLQRKCDCGYVFSGGEREYKTCVACGSLIPASRLFCDCGKFLPMQRDTLTEGDVETAYQEGRFAGVAEERTRQEGEWSRFFRAAGLKNTFTGEPISSAADFYKWKETCDAAYRQQRKESLKNNYYIMDGSDDAPAGVRGDFLESWAKHFGSSPVNSVREHPEVCEHERQKGEYRQKAASPQDKSEAAQDRAFVKALLISVFIAFMIWTCFDVGSETVTKKTSPEIEQSLTPVAFSHGKVICAPLLGTSVAPLSIKTTVGKNYYIVLKPADSVAEHSGGVSFLVEGGKNIEKDVPLGKYEIFYACGDTWYGAEHLFGSETMRYRCEDVFDFTEDENGVYGWTLTLYAVSNGNLDTESVSDVDFPSVV